MLPGIVQNSSNEGDLDRFFGWTVGFRWSDSVLLHLFAYLNGAGDYSYIREIIFISQLVKDLNAIANVFASIIPVESNILESLSYRVE